MAIKQSIQNVPCRLFILYIILLIYAAPAKGNELQFERSLPADGINSVAVKILNGNVRLSSWEESEVLVRVILSVRQYNPDEILTMKKVEDKIEIISEQPFTIAREYNISLPEDMDLDINTVNGSIYIRKNIGKKKLTTVNGNIELEDVIGSAEAKTINGRIFADILFDAESSFATTNGSVNIRIRDKFSVPILVETVSGSIDVIIPEGFSADVNAVTKSGRVHCDAPADGSLEKDSIKGKIFGGGPPMNLKTVSGDIAIRLEKAEKIPSPEARPAFDRRFGMGKPRVFATRTLDPPIIDGRLNDKCWKNAGKIESFIWADGIGLPHENTEAFLLWDEHNFYIGIRCYESSMETIRLFNTTGDNESLATWDDDNIQILLDTTPDTEDYYHITINPIGVVLDREIVKVNIEKRRTENSALGVKWDSEGLFRTDITDKFWSIEANIPFSSLKAKPQEGSIWRFNLHRMEQRRKEYTYWSPTYSTPDWPHVPGKFGELILVGMPIPELSPHMPITPPGSAWVEQAEGTPAMPPAPPAPPRPPRRPEKVLEIAEVVIEGNDRISQEEILSAIDLKQGDPVNMDTLSRARTRLESLGWFQSVGLELTEKDGGVDLIVKVVEKEIISPTQVQVRGSTLFEENQLIDYFNLTPSKTTLQDVDIKCKLIAELYKNKGYEVASAKYSFSEGILTIDIDEGHIDKVEIHGNKKIHTEEIMSALNLKPGMAYNKDNINHAINAMRSSLPYFRSVDWKPQKTDDGLNVVSIEVNEDNLVKFNHNGMGEFNRVHGLQLGMMAQLKSIYTGSRLYAGLNYGISSEIWNYQLGVEKSWFRAHKLSIGADYHKITDTNDKELISDVEHFIAEAILGRAYRDFYQRKGYELHVTQGIAHLGDFGIRYRDDEYTSLKKTNDWSLGGEHKRSNPPIDEGRMRSLITGFTIDTRNSKKEATSGWLNTFSVEYAGEGLGGDFDFVLYQANIRKYSRISGNQFLAFRIKAASADRPLSPNHPRKFYLGGIGTLRGYRFKEFEGDRILLINAEYWLMTGLLPAVGPCAVFFIDSGYAWPYEADASIDDMKTDIGIGLGVGSLPGGLLMVNFALPIEEGRKEAVISFRLSRMF